MTAPFFAQPGGGYDEPRRRVAKQAAQKAIAAGQIKTDADLDAFMAQYGVTPKGATAPSEGAPFDKGPGASRSFGGPPGFVQQSALNARDVARQVGEGALFGWADEAEAGLRTGFGTRGDYGATRDQIAGENEQFTAGNPKVSLGANLLGAVAGPGKAVRAAEKAGLSIPRAVNPVLRGVQRAGAGAVAGGVTGAGLANEDRAGGAVMGGATGGVFGGAVLPFLGWAGRAATNTRAGQAAVDGGGRLVESAARAFGQRAPEVVAAPVEAAGARVGQASRDIYKQRAARLVAARLGRTGMQDAERVIQEANQKFGVDLTLADVTRNLSGLARTATNVPGKARDDIPEFFTGRQLDMQQEAADQVGKLTGTPNKPVAEVKDALVRGRQAVSAKNYPVAYAEGEVTATPELRKVLNDPDVRSLYARALENERRLRSAGESFHPLPELDSRSPLYPAKPAGGHHGAPAEPAKQLFGANGDVVSTIKPDRAATRNPTVAEIDAIKKQLDGEIEYLTERAKAGQLNADEQGRLVGYQALRGRLLGETEKALPKGESGLSTYATARAEDQAPRVVEEALQDGQRFLKLTNGDQARAMIGKYASDPAQLDMLRQSVGKALMDEATALNKVGTGNPLQVLTPQRRRLLRELYPAETAKQIEGYFDLLRRRTSTFRDVTGNSTTARQLLDATGASNTLQGFTKGAQALAGGPLRAMTAGVDALARVTNNINEPTADALGDILTRSGPDALRLLRELPSGATGQDRIRRVLIQQLTGQVAP